MDKDDTIQELRSQVNRLQQAYIDQAAEIKKIKRNLGKEIYRCQKVIKRLLLESVQGRLIDIYKAYLAEEKRFYEIDHQLWQEEICLLGNGWTNEKRARRMELIKERHRLLHEHYQCQDRLFNEVFPEEKVDMRDRPSIEEIKKFLMERGLLNSEEDGTN